MDRMRRAWNSQFSVSATSYGAGVAVIVMVLIVVLLCVYMLVLNSGGRPPKVDRIECPGLTEENCKKLMCVYNKVESGPSCYQKNGSFGYVVKRMSKTKNDTVTIELESITRDTPYGQSIPNVAFRLMYLTENILRFQFKDADNERYEVPIQKEFPLLLKDNMGLDNASLNPSYEVTYFNTTDAFSFGVKRIDEDTYLWDTRIGGLVLSDQYLQIASYLPSKIVYGLGEHVHATLRHEMNYVSWPMFSRDRPATAEVDEDGERINNKGNLYGVHPFYTCLEESGKSHGVFFLNSNAMEATLMPAPAVSFRTIGGILDFFIFIGDSPEHVTQLYTSLIGRTMMPPYWSLGFQLSRYGYNSLSNVEAAINRTREAKIPQAVQYLDIDHMDRNMDFTWDEERFPELPQFLNKMKKQGLKLIVILDPAVAQEDNYTPYQSGLNQSVFIKRSPKWNSSMFLPGLADVNITFGKVWPPDSVAFPDFFLKETQQWWKDLIVKYRDNISFDGLWIDMNEPANFGTNEGYPWYCEENGIPKNECWSLKCPKGIYDDPPYNPLSSIKSSRLSEKTLCMESIQGGETTPLLHYNIHSLYGWSQTQPTLQAAQTATGTRSLVITRSTYPSSGRYAGHWTGDNDSTWKDMKRSIIGILEFNMFGIPYVGADVCGFFQNTTEELCKRWMQLGAFYPFYRNHNGKGERDQDPAILGEDVAEASRKAVERRLNLNPYLYTLFYRAHVDGNTVVRPVFHEFPQDPLTWSMDTQFMWGKYLMITPILREGQTHVPVYLPYDEWWLFANEKSLREQFMSDLLDADEYTPLHVRGGVILPFDNYTQGSDYPENYTRNIVLYIFPKEERAHGELFVDDGVSIDTIENGEYALYQFTYNNCTLKINKMEKDFKGSTPVLESVVVFKVQDITSAFSGDTQFNFTTHEEFDSVVITVKDDMDNFQEIRWEAENQSCQMLNSTKPYIVMNSTILTV